MSDSTIRYERDDDGVVILTLDDPNQSANTMNEAYKASMAATVERLEAEKDDITGVVITSAKKTFFAGGDLNDLKRARKEDAAEVAKMVRELKLQLRRLETLGKPVVAAINGAALGGGLEIALAAHYRIAVDDPKVVLGFPEVQLGLLPGGGGVTRSVRMFGIANALLQLLLQGQRHRPAKALEMGLVNEIVPTRDDLVPAAKKWIAANPEAVQPWDVKGHKIPGGTPSNPKLAANLPGLPGQPAQADQGRELPGAAPHHGRGGRGLAGRLRLGDRDRGPLLHRPRHRPGGEEHDPGVLLRPAGRQGQPRAPGGPRADDGQEGRRARRGHDGRGDRLRVREGRHRGRAQGRRPGRRRPRQGLLGQARGQGRRARQDDAGEGRRAARADHADDRRGGRRGRRPRDRGRLRGPEGQGRGDGRDRAAPGAGRAARLEHVARCRSPRWPRTSAGPTDFIGLHFFSPVDKMPLLEIIKGEQDERGRALPRARLRQADLQDADRGQRLARVLHQPRDQHVHQRGHRDARRGHPGAVDRAGLAPGRLPGPGAAALRRAEHEADAADPQGVQGRHRGRGRRVGREPRRGRHRPHARRVRAPGQARGRGLLRVRRRQAHAAVAGPARGVPAGRRPGDDQRSRDLQERMLFIEAHRDRQVPRRGRDRVGRRREHRLDHGHRLPRAGPAACCSTSTATTAAWRASSPAPASWRRAYGERFTPPESLVARAERGEAYFDGEVLAAA